MKMKASIRVQPINDAHDVACLSDFKISFCKFTYSFAALEKFTCFAVIFEKNSRRRFMRLIIVAAKRFEIFMAYE